MSYRLGPDHPCAYCGVVVYHLIDTRTEILPHGTVHPYEVFSVYEASGRMHTCPAQQPVLGEPPAAVRCPSCRLSVYQLDGLLYDDDAATGAHVCELAAPEPVAAPPVPVPPAAPQARQPTKAVPRVGIEPINLNG